jgi:hypothetical protein
VTKPVVWRCCSSTRLPLRPDDVWLGDLAMKSVGGCKELHLSQAAQELPLLLLLTFNNGKIQIGLKSRSFLLNFVR